MESELNFQSKFSRELQVCGLVVPINEIKHIIEKYKPILLKIPKVSNIIKNSNDGFKTILLTTDVKIPEGLDQYRSIEVSIKLTYENFTYKDALKELLPENIAIPTGFETIGHIAHFNLTPDQHPYRKIIGKVLVDVSST